MAVYSHLVAVLILEHWHLHKSINAPSLSLGHCRESATVLPGMLQGSPTIARQWSNSQSSGTTPSPWHPASSNSSVARSNLFLCLPRKFLPTEGVLCSSIVSTTGVPIAWQGKGQPHPIARAARPELLSPLVDASVLESSTPGVVLAKVLYFYAFPGNLFPNSLPVLNLPLERG